MRTKRGLAALLAAAMTLLLSGCFVKTVDELYTLPRHSDEYDQLEQTIEQVLSSQNAVYAAPVSGVNQQSVQFADLDGDGVDEAIAFLKTVGEKPLKAYIFSRIDGDYRIADVIEGDGTSFASVEYASITGQAGVEIVIGRQLSSDVLQSLGVYAYTDGRSVELMNANYAEYRTTDLDSDGQKEILILRYDTDRQQSVAELYRWKKTQMEREPEAYLTAGAWPVKRILAGNMMQDVPAIFVTSAYEADGLVTDVFALQDDVFQNISARGTQQAAAVTRGCYVYAADIDSDGLIELPQLLPLPLTDGVGENDAAISWYGLTLQGEPVQKLTTYHCVSGGWFLQIPSQWKNRFCVTRSAETDGVRSYAFTQWKNGRRADPIVTVYACSGETRAQAASEDGRFMLAEKSDVIYAARLGTGAWADALSEDSLREMFRFIHIDWNSGET